MTHLEYLINEPDFSHHLFRRTPIANIRKCKENFNPFLRASVKSLPFAGILELSVSWLS